LDLPADVLAVVAATSLGDAAARRLATAPIDGERSLSQWDWVPPGDPAPPSSVTVVDAGVWAAAGAPLVATCRALVAATYGGVRMLAVEVARGERHDGDLPPWHEGDAAAATARSVAGFVRRCAALSTVAVAWATSAPPAAVAAWEAPLLAALANRSTVRSLVRYGGGLTDGLLEGLGRLRLTSLYLSLGDFENDEDDDTDEDYCLPAGDGGEEEEVEDDADASADDGVDDVEVDEGGEDGVGGAGEEDGSSVGGVDHGGEDAVAGDAVSEDDGDADPGDAGDGGGGDGDLSGAAPDSDAGIVIADFASAWSAARHACLRRLLAAVAPTLTRLRMTGADIPPAAWLGGNDAVSLPSLQVLAYPFTHFPDSLIQSLGRACPALCHLDVRSGGPYLRIDDVVDTSLSMHGYRLEVLPHLPALEWLAAGPLHCPPPLGLAATLQRPGRPPLRSFTMFGKASSELNAAAVGFGRAAGGLPAAIDLSSSLSVGAASALRCVPDLDRLSSLKIHIRESGVWAALAGLPVRPFDVSVELEALDGVAAAHFPRLTSLTFQQMWFYDYGAKLDFRALATAAPAVVD